jgi:glucosamine--fructose-6-phosphate aminotransferase (isomerizing)
MTETTRDFPHEMLHEIYQQSTAIERTLTHYLRGNELDASAFERMAACFGDHKDLIIAASGSSRHAGLAAEIMLEDTAGLTVDVEYASEYICRSANTMRNPAMLVLSQSGETADTLAALREGKRYSYPTLAITNVADSSMAQEADISLPTFAGVERAIPATKSFTTQLVLLRLLSLVAAKARSSLSQRDLQEQLRLLRELPSLLEGQLDAWERATHEIAEVYQNAKTLLYLGRGIHYAIAREGALKLKECSYIHAEGYPSGELKHGPNALVSAEVPLVVIATVDQKDAKSLARYEKTVSLLEDMKAQGAKTIVVANTGDASVRARASHVIEVNEANEYLLPIYEIVPLQLFAYFMAMRNDVDVDKPRNLAKSVLSE